MSITLSRREDGRVGAAAVHLDLRKHGFVPVGGDLQGSGIIHHMLIDGVIDPRTRAAEELRARMPAVAFEPSALTGGETCRDVAARVSDLQGVRFDAEYLKTVRGHMGGVRGCTHLLYLAQLMGSTVPQALDVAGEEQLGWDSGEERRLFYRSLIVDGSETADLELQLAVQLSDLYLSEAPAIANPMLRFSLHTEVRILARVDLRRGGLLELRVGERTRLPETLKEAAWRERPEVGEVLLDFPLVGGLSKEVARRFGADPKDRPLCDAVQSLPGTFIQVCGARSESWAAQVLGSDTLVGIGGMPDSCYMWRRDGAMHAAKKPTDPLVKM
jgi:hypothetical protein